MATTTTTEQVRQHAITAEHKSAMWLSRANQAGEAGNRAKEERFLEKAQVLGR